MTSNLRGIRRSMIQMYRSRLDAPELFAPASVQFFMQEGQRLGEKLSSTPKIHEITGIPIPALLDSRLARFSNQYR
jgi:hypothetical protein